MALRERDRTRVTERFGRGAANGLKTLEALYTRPLISVNDVAELLAVTFTAANDLTARFVDAGILQEMTG